MHVQETIGETSLTLGSLVQTPNKALRITKSLQRPGCSHKAPGEGSPGPLEQQPLPESTNWDTPAEQLQSVIGETAETSQGKSEPGLGMLELEVWHVTQRFPGFFSSFDMWFAMHASLHSLRSGGELVR
jgi:hypothetical protein